LFGYIFSLKVELFNQLEIVILKLYVSGTTGMFLKTNLYKNTFNDQGLVIK